MQLNDEKGFQFIFLFNEELIPEIKRRWTIQLLPQFVIWAILALRMFFCTLKKDYSKMPSLDNFVDFIIRLEIWFSIFIPFFIFTNVFF